MRRIAGSTKAERVKLLRAAPGPALAFGFFLGVGGGSVGVEELRWRLGRPSEWLGRGGASNAALGTTTRTRASLRMNHPLSRFLLPQQVHPTRPISMRTRSDGLRPPTREVHTRLLRPNGVMAPRRREGTKR